MANFVIRRVHPHEEVTIRALVQTVVDEVYGATLAGSKISIGEQDWSGAWIALSDELIVGVVLTDGEWIDDLWVIRSARGRGIGHQLLVQAEQELASRGFGLFRLRVIQSNTLAIGFYERHGWQVKRQFPHETLPVIMLEMVKVNLV